MSSTDQSPQFAGSIPQMYERYVVPMFFAAYADDLAARVRALQPGAVLELAAGTGAVTRRLAATLAPAVSILATDLNAGMLAQAMAVGTSRPVEWRQADAAHLPLADASFDAVVCQFGFMFLPDKPAAFAEARRLLRPGGALVFNIWDGIADNEFADVVTEALARQFPHDPPRFLARLPHGFGDTAQMLRWLAEGGFDAPPTVARVDEVSRADSPELAALAICLGTPLRGEIEARAPDGLAAATQAAAVALAQRFGSGTIAGRMRAHVYVARR